MKELVEVIAKSLVDYPDEVVVTETENEKAIVLELRVAQSDLGKVIGKQGRKMCIRDSYHREPEEKSKGKSYQRSGRVQGTSDQQYQRADGCRRDSLSCLLYTSNDATHGDEAVISTPDSKVKVCVIPTNEELAIARETVALVK